MSTMAISDQIKTTISLFAPYGFIKLIHKSNTGIVSIHDEIMHQLDQTEALFREFGDMLYQQLQFNPDVTGVELEELAIMNENLKGATMSEMVALKNIVGRHIGQNVINAINLRQSALNTYEESTVDIMLNKNVDVNVTFIKRQLGMWKDDLSNIKINGLNDELSGYTESISQYIERSASTIDYKSGKIMPKKAANQAYEQLSEINSRFNKATEDILALWNELIAIATLIDGYQVSSEKVLDELSKIDANN